MILISTSATDLENQINNEKTKARRLQFYSKATPSPVPFTPSLKPSSKPSSEPTTSRTPSISPTARPSNIPTMSPSIHPTTTPTAPPTISSQPSLEPSTVPSSEPSIVPSSVPSSVPSYVPSSIPSISSPPSTSPNPTILPSTNPSQLPSSDPSIVPTIQPSSDPSTIPSASPSTEPTSSPSAQPSTSPSSKPTTSSMPSSVPTDQPTSVPSQSSMPSDMPTGLPSIDPTMSPTTNPSSQPTAIPSVLPTVNPTSQPSIQPSLTPSGSPSFTPSFTPSMSPTSKPTNLTQVNIEGKPPTLSPSNNNITITTASPVSITPEPTPTLPNGWIGCTENKDDEDPTRYNVCLDIQQTDPTADPSWIDTFILAKQRWEQVIVGDVEGGVVTPSPQIPICTQLPSYIDDLYLCAMDPPLDGPGGILAGGGPVLRRKDSNIPITGVMIFDRADVEITMRRNTFYATVLHEMGHVFGIGVIWEYKNLVEFGKNEFGMPLFDHRYYVENTHAALEWHALGCTERLPIETDYGGGTAGSHWDEDCLDTELMTGISEQNLSFEKLSRITVGTLQDLGYDVNMTAADEYTSDDIDDVCCFGSTNIRRNQRRRRRRRMNQRATSSERQRQKQKRRKLSPQGFEIAIEFGRNEMKKINDMISSHYNNKQQQQQRHTLLKEDDQDHPNNELYDPMPYYSVLYQEDNHLYSVIVRP